MPELLSPFAPVQNWLCRALRIGWDGSRLQTRGLAVHFREPPEREELDLRDFITRAATLRALAAVGHPRPWALGSCWSSLTDEQAGRATAEVVRAVGADPKRPASPIPFGLFGPWDDGPGAPRLRGIFEALSRRQLQHGCEDTGRFIATFDDGWVADIRPSCSHPTHGPETGALANLAADLAAVAHGALLWEQITPPEKAADAS